MTAASPAEKIAATKEVLGLVPKFWSTTLNCWVRLSGGNKQPLDNTLDVTLEQINRIHHLTQSGFEGAEILSMVEGFPGYVVAEEAWDGPEIVDIDDEDIPF